MAELPKIRSARAATALLLLLALAGCVSAEEIRQQDARQCAGYGFKPDSDAFAACLQRENLSRRYYWTADPWYYYPGPPGW
jgi:hypothetical protein